MEEKNIEKIGFFNNKIIFKDGKFYYEKIALGDVYKEVDGFYVFVPYVSGGFWESWVLREIADKLDSMNREWWEKIEEDLFGDSPEPNNALKEAYKRYKENEDWWHGKIT